MRIWSHGRRDPTFALTWVTGGSMGADMQGRGSAWHYLPTSKSGLRLQRVTALEH